MNATSTKGTRTTVNSTLFSGDHAALAELLVRNTEGDLNVLNSVRDTFTKAFQHIPVLLEERKAEHERKIQEQRERLAREEKLFQQYDTVIENSMDSVRQMMIDNMILAGISKETAVQRVNAQMAELEKQMHGKPQTVTKDTVKHPGAGKNRVSRDQFLNQNS